MPRLYELPTHLQVEDVLIAGLTARQLLRLMIGASLAYGVWDQAVWLPPEVRLALAALTVAAPGSVEHLKSEHPAVWLHPDDRDQRRVKDVSTAEGKRTFHMAGIWRPGPVLSES